jgi:hypothetical protein
MQTTGSSTYPTSVPGDSSAVATALLAGSVEWKNGEVREAVRWVHRAAEAAEAIGDDSRALSLTRVAEDLMKALLSSDGTDLAPHSDDEAAALAPFDDLNDQTIVDSPAVLASRTTQSAASLRRVGAPSEEPVKRPPAPLKPPRPSASSPRASLRPPGGAALRTALRVSVVTDPKNEKVFVATTLDEGALAPAGTKEALLVLLDPDERWFG